MKENLEGNSESSRISRRNFLGATAVVTLAGTAGGLFSSPVMASTAPGTSGSEPSYDDFLTAIRIFESSIDPALAAWYTQNYNTPGTVTYQDVEYPGRVVRDSTGQTTSSPASVKQYFARIGVDSLYTPGSSDPKMFRQMQYHVINYLGFVGYQFSEQDLWDLNYYTHYDTAGLPMYYADVPVSNWANGVRDKVMNLPGKGQVHVTDVNTWKGNFSGKHGIYSFSDLEDPTKQDFVAKDHFQNKYDGIADLLGQRGKYISDYIGTTLYWDQLDPSVSPPPGGRPNAVVITMSGLLAGAHLRGAEGVAALLLDSKNPFDENHTYILQYVYDFRGYQTPFDNEV